MISEDSGNQYLAYLIWLFSRYSLLMHRLSSMFSLTVSMGKKKVSKWQNSPALLQNNLSPKLLSYPSSFLMFSFYSSSYLYSSLCFFSPSPILSFFLSFFLPPTTCFLSLTACYVKQKITLEIRLLLKTPRLIQLYKTRAVLSIWLSLDWQHSHPGQENFKTSITFH